MLLRRLSRLVSEIPRPVRFKTSVAKSELVVGDESTGGAIIVSHKNFVEKKQLSWDTVFF